MKKSIKAFAVLALLSAPAFAEDAYGPNEPRAGTPFNGGGIDPAMAAANKAHNENLRRGIIANGGCNADLLPVWVHQGCAGSVFTAGGDGDNGSGSGSDSGASSGGAK